MDGIDEFIRNIGAFLGLSNQEMVPHVLLEDLSHQAIQRPTACGNGVKNLRAGSSALDGATHRLKLSNQTAHAKNGLLPRSSRMHPDSYRIGPLGMQVPSDRALSSGMSKNPRYGSARSPLRWCRRARVQHQSAHGNRDRYGRDGNWRCTAQ